MSIFISIASYRDPELTRTIKSAINNAANPDQLYFSIVVQDFENDIPDLSWIPNLSLITMHPKEARGAGYARSIAMKAYNNQEYFLQIDSHTLFEKDWDIISIDEHNKAKSIANNDKIILSYFPPPFTIEPDKSVFFIKNDRKKPAYATKQKPLFTRRNNWTAQRVEFADRTRKYPEQSTTILAGFVFTTGNIVDEIPYDPEISFFGEELCFAVRAWTRGWDIYSPSKVILYHFYLRPDYSKVWDAKNVIAVSWKDLEKQSSEKQKRILCGLEVGIYGLGSVRKLEEYERLVGLDFKKIYGVSSDTIVLREKE
jgi:hypothetical protein